MRADLAETISAKLIDLMEKHGSNWRQPWTGSGLYRNAVSKKPYRGVNQLIAAMSGYPEPWFATYKQWHDLGAQVRRGEKATAIFFFKPFNVRDKDTEQERQIMLARTYSVFNIAQVDNPPPLEIVTRPEIERHAECDQIIAETGADIRYGGDRAAYIPSQDCVVLPTPQQFESREAFYGTAFHELSHWSGAAKRLNRDLKGRFGDQSYAFEELIAESASAFILAGIGMVPEPRKETAQYLNSWIKTLRDDKRAIVTAFSHAQKAADFILQDEPTQEPEPTRPEGKDEPQPALERAI
jgi:antirestriction protein ArdC